MMGIVRGLFQWIKSRHEPRWRVCEVEDLPDSLALLTVYAIGQDGQQWYAAMRCPCGCGDTLQLSLHAEASPRWTLRRRWDGAPTLMPSVWRRAACRSHFFLEAGRIRWV